MSDFYKDLACQRQFFEQMQGEYQTAAKAYESVVTLKLAEIHVDLRFGSSRLQEIFLPALNHLRVAEPAEDSVARHTLCLWDGASGGTKIPRPSFDNRHFTDRGDIWGFDNSAYQFAFLYGELSVNMYSRQERCGYYWVDDPRSLPYWCAAAPLRTLLHWCMAEDGRQLLHAAAIGTKDGALLLTGRGGIGKSSTALAGLQHGMLFCGDDYVVVGLEPEPTVYPLYGSAKVHRDQLAHCERLLPCLRNPAGAADEKAVFQLTPVFSAAMPSSMPIKGVAVPRVQDSESSFLNTDITPNEVRNAAGLTTVEQLAYAGNATYAFIDRLCQAVPGYALQLGRDRKLLVDALVSWLQAPPKRSRSVQTPSLGPQPTAVTVIVPAYNRAHLIDEAIANIVGQGYPDLELIVVDDGSTDGTAARVRTHPSAKLFEQPNSGPAQARNRGIMNARGEYLAFLDSDDLWPEGVLRELVRTMDAHPEVDVVMGWPQLAQWNMRSGTYEYFGNPCEGFGSYITGSVFRREVFDRVGLFDADMNFGEDVDWFARAGERGINVMRIDGVSVVVRRHGGNMTEGKNLVELNVLRSFKKALDRKRLASR